MFCSPVLVGRGLGKGEAFLNGYHVPMCLNWRGLLSSGESFWRWCLSRACKDKHVLVPHLKPPMRRWWATDSQHCVRCDICQQMRKWFAAFNPTPLLTCQNRAVNMIGLFGSGSFYLRLTNFRVNTFKKKKNCPTYHLFKNTLKTQPVLWWVCFKFLNIIFPPVDVMLCDSPKI